MPESPPSRGRTATQRSAGSAREHGRATGTPQVQVRYYRRMRPNRVYPFVVSWRGGARAAAPVTVRLVMAGAQVVPAEQVLGPNEDRATFYVTPIAKGWMRGERLEVLQDGRKVQEIRLPGKVTTQRLTWVLLLLTIFVAWWIVPLLTVEARAAKRQTDTEIAEDAPKQYERGPTAITMHINRYLPPPLPALDQHLPDVARALETVPEYVGSSVYMLYDFQTHRGIPIAEGLLGVLILLTLLSWYTHLERRKRRVGKPLPVGGDDDD